MRNTACVTSLETSQPVDGLEPAGDVNGDLHTPDCASAVATRLDVEVTKTATSTTVAEPGGPVRFDFKVTSRSFDAGIIRVLDDSVFGPLAGDDDCKVGTLLAAGASCEFSLTKTITGPAGSVHTNTVTATLDNEGGHRASDTASATVTITDVPSSIDVTKDALPTWVLEPGGPVTFTVAVRNTSSLDSVTITSLVDDIHGDLAGKGTCVVPQTLAPGATYSCSFTATVSGSAGSAVIDTVTASGKDDDAKLVTDKDTASVAIVDVPPAISLVKSPSVTEVAAPGGVVAFRVTVSSLVSEALTLVSVRDDHYGNLGDPDNGRVSGNSCAKAVGMTLAPGATYFCEFTAEVAGEAGDVHVNEVTVSVRDDDAAAVAANRKVSPAGIVSATARAKVWIIGGQGAGAGGGQPSTDMLVPTDALSAVVDEGGPFEGPLGFALWILLTATVILSGAWVIRRQRFGQI